MSAMAGGVTVITHGFQPDGSLGWPMKWVDSMADQIALQAYNRGAFVSIWEYDPAEQKFIHKGSTSPSADPKAALEEVVLKFNWAADSNDPGGGFAEAAGEALFAALMRGSELPDRTPVSFVEMPLHFIGHSRGTVVNSEAIKRLGILGINVDHATTLDPHPAAGAYQDTSTGVNTWGSVTFADNYWRADDPYNVDFDGQPMPGTADKALDEGILNLDGYFYSHSDVHLWYYGTIDPTLNANNGDHSVPTDWYEGLMGPRTQTGFFFSRIIRGDREGLGRDGLKGSSANPLRKPLPAQTTWVVNGDFNYSSGLQFDVAGFRYHGGQNAAIDDTMFDAATLTGAISVLRHNVLFIPKMSGSAALTFRLKTQQVIPGPAQLAVSFHSRELASISLTDSPDWVAQSISLDSITGQAGLLEFQLKDQSSMGTDLHLDDITITGTPVPWANIQLKPLAKSIYDAGGAMTVEWDLDNRFTTPGSTVDLIWDTDRNPYNGISSIAASGLSSTAGQATFTVAALQARAYHLYARITDPTGTFQRFDFLPQSVMVSMASALHGRIAYMRYDSRTVWVFDTDSLTSSLVPIDPNQVPSVGNATWRPDGEWIVFSGGVGLNSQIYTVRSDGSSLRRISDGSGDLVDPAVSADGLKIAYQQVYGNVYVCNFDGSGRVDAGYGIDMVSWSPDGTKMVGCNWAIAGGGYNSDLFIRDLASGALPPITSRPNGTAYVKPAWSPDGSRIAAVFVHDGQQDIVLMATDGSGIINLTPDWASDEYGPSWTPDGQHLLFTSNQGGESGVWVMRADGTGKQKLISGGGAPLAVPTFVPHGLKETFAKTGQPTLNGQVRNAITLNVGETLTGSLVFRVANGPNPNAIAMGVVGYVNANNQWVSGTEPWVVYSGIPSQAGENATANIPSHVVPASAGTYTLRYRAYWVTSNDEAINRFKNNEEYSNRFGTVGTVTVAPPPFDPNFGLLAYYPFDGDATDASGNGHDGAVEGAILASDRFGSANRAYEFAGVSERIVIPASPAFELRTNISISAWVKRGQVGHYDPILCKDDHQPNGSSHFHFRFNENNRLAFNYYIGVWAGGEATGMVTDTEWHHVAVTFDGQQIKFFIDGQAAGELNETRSMGPGGEPLQVGEAQAAGFLHLKGVVDELRIHNRPLSAVEVQQVAAESRTVFELPHRAQSGEIELRLQVPAGKNYVVEATDDFATWTAIASGQSSGGVIVVRETTTAKRGQYFRARLVN